MENKHLVCSHDKCLTCKEPRQSNDSIREIPGQYNGQAEPNPYA